MKSILNEEMVLSFFFVLLAVFSMPLYSTPAVHISELPFMKGKGFSFLDASSEKKMPIDLTVKIVSKPELVNLNDIAIQASRLHCSSTLLFDKDGVFVPVEGAILFYHSNDNVEADIVVVHYHENIVNKIKKTYNFCSINRVSRENERKLTRYGNNDELNKYLNYLNLVVDENYLVRGFKVDVL